MEAPRVGARRLIAPKTVSGGLYGPNATRVFCARLYYNFSEIAPTLLFTSSKGIKENTEENRRRYRQILFATPKEDMEAIAGVILQHETCYQKNDDGVPLLKLLKVS